MEVVLIILGIIVFVLSFLLPAGKKDDTKDSVNISEEAIKEMVGREVEGARSQISDIVDETITYAMEKTERSMDRLTNEKMMAVNEYSDTVLEEINKNHKEVVFLYDMLNDKHENFKNTVSEAAKTASEVKQTVKDAEVTAREAEEKAREAREAVNEAAGSVPKQEEEFVPISPLKVEIVHEEPGKEQVKAEKAARGEKKKESESSPKSTRKPKTSKASKTSDKKEAPSEVPEVVMTLNSAGETGGRNSNERILELHKAGKSNMAIARELGLGIGEVKLVIDLFEGI